MNQESEKIILSKLKGLPRSQLESHLRSPEVSGWLEEEVLKLIVKDYTKHVGVPQCIDFLQSYLHCDLNEAYEKMEKYKL